jgi:hypothetical protein
MVSDPTQKETSVNLTFKFSKLSDQVLTILFPTDDLSGASVMRKIEPITANK